MQHHMQEGERAIFYNLKRSARAKQLRISVHAGGAVVVTAPVRMRESSVHRYIRTKFYWIYTKSSTAPAKNNENLLSTSRVHFLQHKKEALHLVQKKIIACNTFYGFSYNTVRIKQHTTKWGSCSAKRNLNFNYKIIFLPESLQEYIIVHELCHLQEMNHSKDFWTLVAQTVPDYKKRKKQFLSL
ncbi:MAG: hypothetical protein COU33_04125 [Candidatus Magasanikbacteria bacterium CG10_big_fil_rev_8_21_14_0_10_43_6]|uniref:YgjP-like metallopeptidase domain-containing protein n=1 Tax=Candidatus Magasanikbacteria bacterium CG10_big_fil_rev_8_21_14_0_10_43_6 TaxID=1974650 RepID=A0A2M6W0B9_9BACT|nr:MAG: hypothetical protein COU33_04125 [Candidatus Magasanikbacteria bacterium CG10_big_fil_rev_8_21_14_0_10_43_6]